LHITPHHKKPIQASKPKSPIGFRLGSGPAPRIHVPAGLRSAIASGLAQGAFKDRSRLYCSALPLKDAAGAVGLPRVPFYDPDQDLFGTIDLMLVYEIDRHHRFSKPGPWTTKPTIGSCEPTITMCRDGRQPINLYLVSLTRNEYRTVNPKEDSR
jgi:hypothetical protein